MKRRSVFIIVIIFVFLLSNCGSKEKNEPSQNQNQSDQIPTAPSNNSGTESTKAPDQPAVKKVDLGDSQDVPDGGFSFQQIPGYELASSGGMVAMTAPNADPDLGPVMQLMGWNEEADTTNEDLYEQLKKDTPMHISIARPIQIDGLDGLTADISGDNNGKAMVGQAAMIMVNPRQQFVLMLGAPKEEWDTVSPYFDAVIASIRFSQLEIPVPQSNLSAGSYAYVNSNVIRDIVVVDEMAYTASLGGMVAWNLSSGYAMQYTPLQGMGHVSANAITACNIPESRILVGTLEGLSIYDPSTGLWDKRDLLPADSKVNSSKITRLFCDQANNRLLIGYNGLGILDLITGNFELVNKQSGLLWDEVQDIAVAGKDIWIATGYKGISRINGSTVTNFSLENGMPDERTQAIAISRDGTVWAGGSSGLMSFKNGKWTLFGSDTEAKLVDINEIEISADGNLWVATASMGGGRICNFNLSSTKCDSEFKDPDFKPILALSLNGQKQPLYGTSNGLFTFDGATNKSLQTSDQLLSNYVDSFTQSPDGNLWLGTDSGIQVLNPADPNGNQWISYSKAQNNGLGGNWASSIAVGANEIAWAAIINGDASRYENGNWTTLKDIYSFNVVAIDSQNQAWFGDDGKGIVVLNQDGSNMFTLTAADGLPSDKVYAIISDPAGGMWIGTDSGLAKYENGALKTVFGKDDTRLPNRYIRDLAIAPDGTLLIGMFTGVASFDGSQVEVLLDVLKDGFSAVRLTCIAVSADGKIWAGTDKGLLETNDAGQWSLLTTKSGMLTNYISALYVDSSGALWVGGGGSNFDGGGILLMVP